jgi:hypothetical protein
VSRGPNNTDISSCRSLSPGEGGSDCGDHTAGIAELAGGDEQDVPAGSLQAVEPFPIRADLPPFAVPFSVVFHGEPLMGEPEVHPGDHP